MNESFRLRVESFQGMAQFGKGAARLLPGLMALRKGVDQSALSKVALLLGMAESLIGAVEFGKEWVSHSY